MKYTQSLPEPASDALQHSQNLIDAIHKEIIENNGAITFRRYMEMALYEPGLGYYVAGTHKIGEQGDFVTAPEISPLFSQCIGKQCSEVIKTLKANTNNSLQSNRVDILELGAGTGQMAAEILLSLETIQQLPDTYYILDLSPDLKQRQLKTIKSLAPHLLEHIIWLTDLPVDFSGIILGNEVLDAMPVDIFTLLKEKVFEHHVIWEDEKLVEQLKPARKALEDAVNKLKIPADVTPYTSEINPNIDGWLESLSHCLKRGIILLADYGYPRQEYYLHERNKGTLICHYQHKVNEAPLYYPGLQDITASVDFTSIAEAADKCHLTVAGFTSQASFLANTDLEYFFKEALNKAPNKQYLLAQQVRLLSLPSEMGERFKFIALSKAYNHKVMGFETHDQRYRL